MSVLNAHEHNALLVRPGSTLWHFIVIALAILAIAFQPLFPPFSSLAFTPSFRAISAHFDGLVCLCRRKSRCRNGQRHHQTRQPTQTGFTISPSR